MVTPVRGSGPGSPRARLLLVEPDYVMRRTVAMTARSTEIAEITEASTYERAREIALRQAFDGLIVSLDGAGAGLDLLTRVRSGASASDIAVPVAVLTDRIDAATVLTLRTHTVARVVVKPCKVKTLMECIAALARTNTAADAAA